MVAYKYRAISRSGEKVNGVVEAYDEFEAVAKIKQECNVVLKIEPVPERKTERIDLTEPMWVSNKILSLTASQFAILLRAGLPLSRTVEIVATQSTDKLMKRILKQVQQDVAAGYGLAQSLELRGKKIPVTFIETVRAGEQSATLAESFDRLALYYEKTNKLKSKVKSAMMYPIIVCVMAVIVVAIVVNVAVPTVLGTIMETGGEVPLPTQMLMSIYNFFKNYWALFFGILFALIIAFIFYSRSEKGKVQVAKGLLKLPVLGKINRMTGAAEFANTMATLLTAGLPLTQCLNITGKVISNLVIGSSVDACAVGVESGKRFGAVLADNEYLPPLLVEMAGVGEESGSLEKTLTTIGAYYDAEVEQATNRAIGMLEPVMTIVLGVIIGFIVIAMYLPMFTMYTGM